jgi:hypothetical protein
MLVCVGVAGCDSKAGAAAVINGDKISESEVADLVRVNAPEPGRVRSTVLNALIQEKVIEKTLAASGGLPPASVLQSLHDEAVGRLLGAQSTGAEADQALRVALDKFGIKPNFDAEFIRGMSLQLVLVKKLNATSGAQLVAEIEKRKVHVSVNPRFGGWNPSQLALTSFGKDQVPSMIAFDGTLGPTPAPEQPQQ